MLMKQLSEKRQKIIGYIGSFLTEHGYPPTVRDIQAGCRISSTSVVDYNLKALERGGYLRRQQDISRGIELLGRAVSETLAAVPLMGTIAAGKPIPVPDAETTSGAYAEEMLGVAPALTGGRDGVFALKVKGLSMIDALINDGDIVLLEKTSRVENGEMAAVWLKSEKEVTLKKVFSEPGRVRLQPANREMAPLFTSPDNAEVQGRVIAVIRRVA